MPLVRRVGDELVVLHDGHAAVVAGEAVEAFERGGPSRRTILKAIGAGTAIAGVAVVAAPSALAAGSTPTLTLTPASGPRGQIVTISGSNYPPNSLITVTYDGNVVATSPATVTTDASGNIPTGVTFQVPTGSGNALGAHNVAVVAGGHSGTAVYTVLAPTVTLSRTTFPRNGSPSSFTVTASSGFLAGSTITVSNTASYTITPATVTANGSGQIPTSQTFTVTYGNGAHTGVITFTDSASNTVSVATSA